MKTIGYGICGPGEANRYMRATLEEFKRLCDEVVILCNNTGVEEHKLIDEFGFKRVSDRREWGKFQWRIKQDFIERDIKQIAKEGDILVCLDMDEVFHKDLTREWLVNAPLDAYKVFIVDIWNDPDHFKLDSCFWNVRIWRWNGDTQFKVKPVHCGLAPEWTYKYNRHAPFILKHYGLMLKEDRDRKLKRYEKYDPTAEHLGQVYYDMLKDDSARPFDENQIQSQIVEEVATYKETKPREKTMSEKNKPRFAYVRNPHGEVIDIPEKHLQMTLKRGGFEFISWADEQEEEIEEMFSDDTSPLVEEEKEEKPTYNRSTADEKAELDALNAKDGESITLNNENVGEAIKTAKETLEDHPKPDPNKKKEEEKLVKKETPKKTPVKKEKKVTKK